MTSVTMTLCICVGRVVQLVLGFRECNNVENFVPHKLWQHWPGGMIRGILWTGRYSGIIGCIEYQLTKPVLARGWSQTVLTESGARQRYPITKSMCSNAAWFRAQNSVDRRVAASHKQQPLVARVDNTELDSYP